MFGCAVSEVEVDLLSGDVRCLRSDVLFDAGESLNPLIDIGQAEGAWVMGQGAYLLEDTVYSKDGVFMSNDTWEYKPPLALNVPIDFRVELLKDSAFEKGVFRAKAVGEPPLLLSFSLISALRQAIASSRTERGKTAFVDLDFPATCDRVWKAADISADELAASL